MIHWHVGDAGDPDLLDMVGSQDIVVANNFICHMVPSEAEKCLRNIARVVRPGGYLFVSGIDLDVRTQVACDLGWEPLQELLEEVHEGDPYLKGILALSVRRLGAFEQRKARLENPLRERLPGIISGDLAALGRGQ